MTIIMWLLLLAAHGRLNAHRVAAYGRLAATTTSNVIVVAISIVVVGEVVGAALVSAIIGHHRIVGVL